MSRFIKNQCGKDMASKGNQCFPLDIYDTGDGKYGQVVIRFEIARPSSSLMMKRDM
jgi:hypothetical protein